MEDFFTTPVEGAPYQPGQRVKVVDAIDIEIHDVSMHIGKVGKVKALDYSEGSGQLFPTDPFVVVDFKDGSGGSFWSDELAPVLVLIA